MTVKHYDEDPRSDEEKKADEEILGMFKKDEIIRDFGVDFYEEAKRIKQAIASGEINLDSPISMSAGGPTELPDTHPVLENVPLGEFDFDKWAAGWVSDMQNALRCDEATARRLFESARARTVVGGSYIRNFPDVQILLYKALAFGDLPKDQRPRNPQEVEVDPAKPVFFLRIVMEPREGGGPKPDVVIPLRSSVINVPTRLGSVGEVLVAVEKWAGVQPDKYMAQDDGSLVVYAGKWRLHVSAVTSTSILPREGIEEGEAARLTPLDWGDATDPPKGKNAEQVLFDEVTVVEGIGEPCARCGKEANLIYRDKTVASEKQEPLCMECLVSEATKNQQNALAQGESYGGVRVVLDEEDEECRRIEVCAMAQALRNRLNQLPTNLIRQCLPEFDMLDAALKKLYHE